MSRILAALALASLVAPLANAQVDPFTHTKIAAAAQGDHRTAANRARNEYRHPVSTLSFFGLRDDMTVVEVSPGGGWYTEILAPVLRENGKLYAAAYNPDSEVDYYQRSGKRFMKKMADTPKLYDQVEVTVFEPPKELDIAPEGSADLVVAFRNLHGWMGDDVTGDVLKAIHRALKPGGVFGIVQHRGDGSVQDPKAESGYVNEQYVIDTIEAAGFKLDARAEINANPMDTAQHPSGVWSLPPALDLGEENRAMYLAIGESDRMTLRFVKAK